MVNAPVCFCGPFLFMQTIRRKSGWKKFFFIFRGGGLSKGIREDGILSVSVQGGQLQLGGPNNTFTRHHDFMRNILPLDFLARSVIGVDTVFASFLPINILKFLSVIIVAF